MTTRYSLTNALFLKSFFAFLLAVALSIFCTSKIMVPAMREAGNAIHIHPFLLQDMLSATLADKSPSEIVDYLSQCNDPFLNQAHVGTVSELISQDAPQKYGLWLRNHERMKLLNGRPFSVGDFQPISHPNKHINDGLFPKPPIQSHSHQAKAHDSNQPRVYIDRAAIVPRSYQTITIQSLLSSAQHITAYDPYMAPKLPHQIEHRSAFLIIPIKESPYVIFTRRPNPLPPVITWPTILLGTGLILLIVLATVSFLIIPIAMRISKIASTCQKVQEGDYKARCGDQRKDFIGKLSTNIDEMTTSIGTHLDQQKGLLQAIAHELRTPLSRIRFTLEMLDLPEDDENAQARLASIDEDLTEIDNLTKELSYFNYVDAGNGRRNFETSAVKDLIELTLKQRSLALEPFDVQVTGMDDSLMIEADPNAFKRVIGNLLSNAARYAKKNIRVSVKQLPEENMIEVAVDDDGIGIPEDKRESIFDPFVCLEKSRSKSTGGFGLGLAIAHRIMKIHSGSISAHESDLGGARFLTRWPITQS